MPLVTVLLAGIALTPRAEAQDPTRERADALIAEGIALREAGRDEAALARFEQAHAIAPSGHSLAQMALAEQALGRWVDAETHMRAALDGDDAWVRDRRATLEESLRAIERHLGRLEVLGDVAGATVRVNGRPSGTLPLDEPIRVPVGTVVVEVEADGYLSVQRSVVVGSQTLRREHVTLVPRRSEDEQAAPDTSSDGPPSDPPSEPETPASPAEPAAEPSETVADPPATRALSEPLLLAGLASFGGAALSVAFMSGFWAERERLAGVWNDDACWPSGGTRAEACGDVGAAVASNEALAQAFAVAAAVTAGAGALLVVLAGELGPTLAPSRVACLPWTLGVACGGQF